MDRLIHVDVGRFCEFEDVHELGGCRVRPKRSTVSKYHGGDIITGKLTVGQGVGSRSRALRGMRHVGIELWRKLLRRHRKNGDQRI